MRQDNSQPNMKQTEETKMSDWFKPSKIMRRTGQTEGTMWY